MSLTVGKAGLPPIFSSVYLMTLSIVLTKLRLTQCWIKREQLLTVSLR